MNEQIQPELINMLTLSIQLTYPQKLWVSQKAKELTKCKARKISLAEVIRDLVQEAMDSEQV